jgi:hypothetical protein
VIITMFTSTSAVPAQIAVTTSGLNVRTGQSAQSRIEASLEQGDTVDLLSLTKRRGYYHVKTRDASPVTGWAWAARLAIIDSSGGVALASKPSASAAVTVTAGAGSVDSTWSKTPSNASDIHWSNGNHALCQADGVGGDPATNHMKNRSDEPATYHEVSWDALATLPFPRNRLTHREGDQHPWPAADLATIAEYEGTAISVVGFLSGIKVEGKESTNCGETDSARVDWHMYLTAGPHQKTHQAIVVETTPRVRLNHPQWSVEAIKGFVQTGDTVRISGWLMLDPEHWVQMWQYRGPADTTGTRARITLWEIHPITAIEVRRNGTWRSLDTP